MFANTAAWAAAHVTTALYHAGQSSGVSSQVADLAMRKCITPNNLFTRKLGPPIRKLVGAVGALIPILAGAMFILMATAAVVMIATKSGPKWIRYAIAPLVIAIGIFVVFIFAGVAYNAIKANCTTPFG